MLLKQLGPVSDFSAGTAAQVRVNDEPVAVFHLDDGRLCATSDQCTHCNGLLSDGVLCDSEIECPLHQGRFDVMTGRALGVPCTEDVRTFPLTVQNGVLCLHLQEENL